jgi:hypothetical protein
MSPHQYESASQECGGYHGEPERVVSQTSRNRAASMGSRSSRMEMTTTLPLYESPYGKAGRLRCKFDKNEIDRNLSQRVLSFAVKLVEILVGLRKATSPVPVPEDDELSHSRSMRTMSTTMSTFLKINGLELSAEEYEELCPRSNIGSSYDDDLSRGMDSVAMLKSGGSDDNLSSPNFVPPEIEMLNMEADLLLDSIRNGISLDLSLSEDKEEKEEHETPHDVPHRRPRWTDFDGEAQSYSSYGSDDDGMRSEIQNLGMAVSNLRQDLVDITLPMGNVDYESVNSALGDKVPTLKETWSRAVEEVIVTMKTLQNIANDDNANLDYSPDERLRIKALIRYWVPTILWSVTVMLFGRQLAACFHAEKKFGDIHSSEVLENLELMFLRKD